MNTTETKCDALDKREQSILDTALLESDQLLARSLHSDQQRRKRRFWWSVLVIGGVVMSGIWIAIAMGWLTLSGQVTAHGEPQNTQAKREDSALQKRMLAATESDRWDVGAKIGMDLVKIPGDRPYRLLAENWDNIAVNARKQILKGFTPGMMGNKKMHARFFDVMDLGMSDEDPQVRSFAANYLKMQGLPDYEYDLSLYRSWRKKSANLSAKQIMQQVKEGGHSSSDEEDELQKSTKADFQRAWKMFFARKYPTSERLFRRVLESDPKNPHAMNGLGWSLLNQEKVKEAKNWLQKSIKLEPGHLGALSGVALANKKEGNIDEAVKIWERVAKESPGPNDATGSLAKIYMDRKQYEKAVACYEKLVQWHPKQKAFPKLLEKAKAELAVTAK